MRCRHLSCRALRFGPSVQSICWTDHPACLIQRAGGEASDWEERVGQGAAEQNLPAVRSQREWIPVPGRDRQGRARRARAGCKCEHCCGVCFEGLVHGADEQGVGGWVQELFKCKPAIMRAFQAAKGVHKVLNGCGCCAIAFLVLLPLCGSQCVCV